MTQLTEGLTNQNMVQMSSLEIAEHTSKNHKELLRSIRQMEKGWSKVTERKFALSEYKDSTGRTLPCYNFTKSEFLYIISKFSDEIRAKLVLRWEQLELERANRTLDFYQKVTITSQIKDFYIYARSKDRWLIPTSQVAKLAGLSPSTVCKHFAKSEVIESKYFVVGDEIHTATIKDPSFSHHSYYFSFDGLQELSKVSKNTAYSEIALMIQREDFTLEEDLKLLAQQNSKAYRKLHALMEHIKVYNELQDPALRLDSIEQKLREEFLND